MLLIVDDDPKFPEATERLLNAGRGIFFAHDARNAKELISCVGTAFSVALIDLDLPGQDGFSLIQELHRSYPDLPAIAISRVFQPAVLESAKLVGAVDTLSKPINAPEWNV